MGPGNLPNLGGRLCLDFANTLEFRGTGRAQDWLASFDDLVTWAEHAGAFTPAVAERQRARGASSPSRARETLRRATDLREVIYAVGSAIAAKKAPPVAAMENLNAQVFTLLGQTQFATGPKGPVRQWAGKEDALERALWPVAWSVFDLLDGTDLSRLRECANNECHWLFMDLSRNRSRRWCSMEICGNVLKARRHRQRK